MSDTSKPDPETKPQMCYQGYPHDWFIHPNKDVAARTCIRCERVEVATYPEVSPNPNEEVI